MRIMLWGATSEGNSRNGHSKPPTVEFIVFETPKLLMVPTLVVLVVRIIRAFFMPERTRKMLAATNDPRRAGYSTGA